MNRNRPAQEPGGVECMKCGCIFIGEEWHSVCGVCFADNTTGQTSDARDGLIVAGQLMRAAMDMQEARELETMHISQPAARRIWDDAKSAWDAAMQEAGK